MGEHSSADEPPGDERTLVTIQSGSAAKRPLFCVHAEAGDVSLYDDVAGHLPSDQPVLGLRAPATDEVAADGRLESLAARHLQTITAAQHTGPYLLVGECTGGALAYEIARQLRAAGREVALLALVDAFPGGAPPLHRLMPRPLYRMIHRSRILGVHLMNLVRLDRHAKMAYVRAKALRARAAFARRATRLRGRSAAGGSPRFALGKALAAYTAAPSAGAVVVFRAARLPFGVKAPRDLGWGALAEEVRIETLPGYFTTSISEPGARVLASGIARHLARATTQAR